MSVGAAVRRCDRYPRFDSCRHPPVPRSCAGADDCHRCTPSRAGERRRPGPDPQSSQAADPSPGGFHGSGTEIRRPTPCTPSHRGPHRRMVSRLVRPSAATLTCSAGRPDRAPRGMPGPHDHAAALTHLTAAHDRTAAPQPVRRRPPPAARQQPTLDPAPPARGGPAARPSAPPGRGEGPGSGHGYDDGCDARTPPDAHYLTVTAQAYGWENLQAGRGWSCAAGCGACGRGSRLRVPSSWRW